jgi:hypothetical protein
VKIGKGVTKWVASHLLKSVGEGDENDGQDADD